MSSSRGRDRARSSSRPLVGGCASSSGGGGSSASSARFRSASIRSAEFAASHSRSKRRISDRFYIPSDEEEDRKEKGRRAAAAGAAAAAAPLKRRRDPPPPLARSQPPPLPPSHKHVIELDGSESDGSGSSSGSCSCSCSSSDGSSGSDSVCDDPDCDCRSRSPKRARVDSAQRAPSLPAPRPVKLSPALRLSDLKEARLTPAAFNRAHKGFKQLLPTAASSASKAGQSQPRRRATLTQILERKLRSPSEEDSISSGRSAHRQRKHAGPMSPREAIKMAGRLVLTSEVERAARLRAARLRQALIDEIEADDEREGADAPIVRVDHRRMAAEREEQKQQQAEAMAAVTAAPSDPSWTRSWLEQAMDVEEEQKQVQIVEPQPEVPPPHPLSQPFVPPRQAVKANAASASASQDAPAPFLSAASMLAAAAPPRADPRDRRGLPQSRINFGAAARPAAASVPAPPRPSAAFQPQPRHHFLARPHATAAAQLGARSNVGAQQSARAAACAPSSSVADDGGVVIVIEDSSDEDN